MRTLLLILALVSCAYPAALWAAPPNFVIIFIDDMGYGDIGPFGSKINRTPHLDRMAKEGRKMTSFYVASPVCTPSRAALMTGCYPQRVGLDRGSGHIVLFPGDHHGLNPKEITIAETLKSVGYATGCFGKWHLGDEEPYQPHTRGFDEAFIHGAGGIGQAYNCSCADAPGNKYFDPVIRHNGSFVKTKGFCTDLFFTAALGWIKQQKDGDAPFFAYITTNAPHGPFIAPPNNTKHFTDLGFGKSQAGFYGMIENIDENMGRLLAKLDEWKLFENTVVIFMSDNGMTGGGSGRLGQAMGRLPDGTEMKPYNAGMKGLKGSADEGGVRVPFLVRWDGHWKAGRDLGTVSAHIDILPTLAAIAGISSLPENQVEGRSLLPLLSGEKTALPDRYIFTHRGRWPTGTDPDTHQWKNFAVRSQRWRYVGPPAARKGSTGPGALYDMQKDPGQKTNVAGQHAEVMKKMRAAYGQFWSEARPLMVNESTPMSPTRPFHEWFAEQMKSSGIPDWKPSKL